MKRFSNLGLFLIIVSVIIIILGCSIYNYNIGPVSKDNTQKEFIIESGDTYLSIIGLLTEKKLIKSDFFYRLYVKLMNPQELVAGKYYLSENMGLKEIFKTFENDRHDIDAINITFNEGINMRRIAKIIENNTNNTIDDVFDLLKDDSYLDEVISNYWFLDEDIKDREIYYPLEGYLFPDTYQFASADVTVKEIFNTMLDHMESQLEKYKQAIENSKYSVHEILTLASIIELEAATSTDRSGVAGVFYNRLDDNWTLGSDVTTYYAEKIDDWSYELTFKQLDECNSYNTRGTCFNGLPIGPICNPSLESIDATINPDKHNYYYFVADCDGKTYLNFTETEHNKTISKLKGESNWCDS